MKKNFIVFSLLTGILVFAQKKKTDIMFSKNIQEIENFLKTAHPDDPKKFVLKQKLIALKNAAWMKPNQFKSYTVQPSFVEIPKSVLKQRNNNEVDEFKKLISENSSDHQNKTVKILNQLFENDISNKEAILLMQNKSDCNIIVRIQGKNFYNLAIPARSENSMILKKGDYQLQSTVCDIPYNASKNIAKNMLVILKNPVVNYERSTFAEGKKGGSN